MSRIDELDDTKSVITSSSWRFLCMGSNKKDPTKPGGSNRDWALYRGIVGMIDPDTLKPTEGKSFTRKQAFLLLVLGRLEYVCAQIDCPVPKKTELDLVILMRIARVWSDTIGEPMENAFEALASVGESIPGHRLKEVVREWAGKPWSDRHVRREVEAAGEKFGEKHLYSPTQLQRIYRRATRQGRN
jgi:hypothetical protein